SGSSARPSSRSRSARRGSGRRKADAARDADAKHPSWRVSFGRWELASEQLAQHVGDGDAALERRDLDAAAQVGGDVDREAGGEAGRLGAVRRAWLRRFHPALRITRPCDEMTPGRSCSHRAILPISAESAETSRAARPLPCVSQTSRPDCAVLAKATRWPIVERRTGGSWSA